MKRIITIGLVSILLIVVGIGCVPTAAQPAAQPTVNINTVNAEVTAVKTWSTGIDAWRNTTVDPMIAKVNRGEIGGGSTNYQSQLDSIKATMTGTDSKITALEARVTALENKITALSATTPVGSTGISTGGTTGQNTQFTPGTPPSGIATSASGGVVSQVNFVSGMSQMYASPSGSSSTIWYMQRLINTSTAIQYVRPILTLSLASNYGYTTTFIGGVNINVSSGQCSMSAVYTPPNIGTNSTQWPQSWPPAQAISSIGIAQSTSAPYLPTGTTYFSVAPGLGTVTNSFMFMPIAGCGTGTGEYYIAPGGYVDLTVQLSGVYTQAATLWNVAPSYSAHP
jgi:hypothetical protein